MFKIKKCGIIMILLFFFFQNSAPITAFSATDYVNKEYFSDLTAVGNYLLRVVGSDALNKKFDLNDDGCINIIDYILIKNKIISAETFGKIIYVSDTDELKSSLKNALPGDEIILRSGEYETDQSGTKASLFMSGTDGTAEKPIMLHSEDPDKPAVLKGKNSSEKIVLYITGDYWIISDIKINTAQKGIVLDNSCHSVIDSCEVYNIGSEGIHLRDDSSSNIVKNCFVHDTGIVSPKYGEAVYIGSAKSTSGYGYACDNNLITGCRLGPGVAAEHVDIKEYTTGSIVENCIFDGKGMTGENYADSFVDVKGNDSIIRNNTGYRNNNIQITEAIQLHVQVDGWAENNVFCGNIFYLDDASSYITKSWDGSVTVFDNKRIPDGNMYIGDAIKQE